MSKITLSVKTTSTKEIIMLSEAKAGNTVGVSLSDFDEAIKYISTNLKGCEIEAASICNSTVYTIRGPKTDNANLFALENSEGEVYVCSDYILFTLSGCEDGLFVVEGFSFADLTQSDMFGSCLFDYQEEDEEEDMFEYSICLFCNI